MICEIQVLVPKKSLRLFGRSASVVKAFEEFRGGFLIEQPEVEARLGLGTSYRPLAWRLTSTFTLFDGCGFCCSDFDGCDFDWTPT